MPYLVLFAWVQVTLSGFAVRAVVEGDLCPEAVIDGTAIPMSVRARASTLFPVTVCELALPAGLLELSIEEQRLPVPDAEKGDVALIGDTGCRIWVPSKGGPDLQNCLDPKAWPFAAIAQNIAAAKPKLVVHVGDYVYRESPCPEEEAGCAKSPHGDNWETWRVDFFEPAKKLLAQAPWLFVRGNHELCDRVGHGWFRLLDPGPYRETCIDETEPYLFSNAGINWIVMDNVAVKDSDDPADPVSAQKYRQQFQQVNQMVHERNWQQAWLVMHEPVWGAKPTKERMRLFNPTLQSAFEAAPKEIQLVLSGHIHYFQVLNSQMIIGISGTKLEKFTQEGSQILFSERPELEFKTWVQFGHVMVREGSQLDLYDLNNQVTQSFTLSGGRLHLLCDQKQ